MVKWENYTANQQLALQDDRGRQNTRPIDDVIQASVSDYRLLPLPFQSILQMALKPGLRVTQSKGVMRCAQSEV